MPVLHQAFRSYTENKPCLADLKYWSIITAYGLAAAETIRLTSLHLDILDWMRHDYEHYGPTTIPDLAFRIETAFADQGGNLLVISLFPQGLMQALKIAGLPVQPGMTKHTVSMH